MLVHLPYLDQDLRPSSYALAGEVHVEWVLERNVLPMCCLRLKCLASNYQNNYTFHATRKTFPIIANVNEVLQI
jgi:hypothetical protein